MRNAKHEFALILIVDSRPGHQGNIERRSQSDGLKVLTNQAAFDESSFELSTFTNIPSISYQNPLLMQAALLCHYR